jgi:chaperonin GroEL
VEQEYLKEQAKAAVQTVRLGLQEGVAPGGGVAFLRCLPALEQLTLPDDERPALKILCKALQAPMQAILRNSGFDPAPILAQLERAGNGAGFDVLRGQVIDVYAAHIVDPVQVLTTALQTAISGALMAMTIEVLIHKPRHNRDEAVDFNP